MAIELTQDNDSGCSVRAGPVCNGDAHVFEPGHTICACRGWLRTIPPFDPEQKRREFRKMVEFS